MKKKYLTFFCTVLLVCHLAPCAVAAENNIGTDTAMNMATNLSESQAETEIVPTEVETICDSEVSSIPQEICNSTDNDISGKEQSISFSLFSDLILPLGIEFFGAFLGVLSALALDSMAEKKQWEEVNASLYGELQDIGEELEGRTQEDYSYYQYITPIWDINMASGNLSLLTHSKAKKKYIKKDYIDIYAKIHYAQTLERDYIQGRLLMRNSGFDGEEEDRITADYIKLIDNARKREAISILEMIKKLPKEAK